MKKGKVFDCVQMKWDIQQELRKTSEGLSLPDRQRLMRESIETNPILAAWHRQAGKTSTPAAKVAESPARYVVPARGRKRRPTGR